MTERHDFWNDPLIRAAAQKIGKEIKDAFVPDDTTKEDVTMTICNIFFESDVAQENPVQVTDPVSKVRDCFESKGVHVLTGRGGKEVIIDFAKVTHVRVR